MTKELEALDELKYQCVNYEANIERFDIIETALKDYEKLKERTKLDSFECLLRIESILPRGKELLIPVAKELKRKQDLENMLHKMNVKYGYKEYLKIIKALEIIKKHFKFEFDDETLTIMSGVSDYCHSYRRRKPEEVETYYLLKEVLK